MLIAKILLILGFIWKLGYFVRSDESLKDQDKKIGARLATATIFIITLLLYYFAGIFNLNAVC